MKSLFASFALLVATIALSVDGFSCGSNNVWGERKRFDCPRPGDPREAAFCCDEHADNPRCCDINDSDLHSDVTDIGKGIAKLIGIIVGAALVVLAISVVCCCLCPFCLLYKKRTRGRVIRRPEENQPPAAAVPPQQPLMQQQQAYPPPQQEQQPYPPPQQQQPYPPPQQYPQQPYPPASGSVDASGYPAAPPPYPGPPLGGGSEAPPLTPKESYQQSQPAYNPNF